MLRYCGAAVVVAGTAVLCGGCGYYRGCGAKRGPRYFFSAS